ncbi:hypothetical protein PRUPE_1G125600 [Prunus persica]|uniref:Uncharacterized protein n=1 Tax=Prunus persica TaxID=3760 RepID=A0A251QWD4_PRUPE|nr:hypothetical protein PRUPE_1G125600 [Prunus persica]
MFSNKPGLGILELSQGCWSVHDSKSQTQIDDVVFFIHFRNCLLFCDLFQVQAMRIFGCYHCTTSSIITSTTINGCGPTRGNEHWIIDDGDTCC